jgi:hypothetical protein
MTTILLALAAILLSAVPMVLLCASNPKRARAMGARQGQDTRHQRLLVIAAILPGLITILLAESAVFMLWLGGAALVGWLSATYLPADVRFLRRS